MKTGTPLTPVGPHVRTVALYLTTERGGLFAPPFFFYGECFHKVAHHMVRYFVAFNPTKKNPSMRKSGQRYLVSPDVINFRLTAPPIT